jgi:hypothetical protein
LSTILLARRTDTVPVRAQRQEWIEGTPGPVISGRYTLTRTYRRYSSRSPKDGGFSGQASWLSSNINLVNTSMLAPPVTLLPATLLSLFPLFPPSHSIEHKPNMIYSYWGRNVSLPPGAFAYGHTLGYFCYHLVCLDRSFWAVSPITLCPIP